MSHQTYFQSIPRDITQMTLYYLPPEKLRSTCESNDEFQRICQDSRFLENYAREKLLLSPQVGQTHFLPRKQRFELLGQIGYQPLISYVLSRENDIDMTDIVHIGIGAVTKGHENIMNWTLEQIRISQSADEANLISMLVNAAIKGDHPGLAERILNTSNLNISQSKLGYVISKELGKKNMYEVFQRLLRDVSEDRRLEYDMAFIAGALSVGNLRYFNESLTPTYQEEIDHQRVRDDYNAIIIYGAVESENPDVLDYVLKQLRAHKSNILRDYSTILFTLPISNPLIWNLRKQEYRHGLLTRSWAYNMGFANQSQTFNEMMREFTPPLNTVISFIDGLADGGHFQTMFSMLDKENWPTNISYALIARDIAKRDDVENFIRLLQGLKEHGISIITSEMIQWFADTNAKDILKWMTIHGMIPLNA